MIKCEPCDRFDVISDDLAFSRAGKITYVGWGVE